MFGTNREDKRNASGSWLPAGAQSRRVYVGIASVLILFVATFIFFHDYYVAFGEAVCANPVTPASAAIQQGRHNNEFPSPRCCVDEGCLLKDRGRYAVLTTLRTDNYLPLVKHLACSFHNTNPEKTLIVATVRGDLSADVLEQLHAIKNVKVHYWEEFRVENKLRERFALNWVKIRAWEMDEYDAILMLDGDTLVNDVVDPLWKVPAHFATVLDQDKMVSTYNALGRMQGGVVLLRPCPAVAQHMMHLVSTNETLQFSKSHAEQSFFDWYFRFDRWSLPVKYNAVAGHLKENGQFTNGGTKPVIIHYSWAKPMVLTPDKNHEQKVAMGC